MWNYSSNVLQELSSSFLPLPNYFLLIFLSQTCFLWTYLLLLTNGNWKQIAFQLQLAIMMCFLNQHACPRCLGREENSESFKCNCSAGTVSHNGRPKDSNFVLSHCPLFFKYIYPELQTQSSQDECLLFCEV